MTAEGYPSRNSGTSQSSSSRERASDSGQRPSRAPPTAANYRAPESKQPPADYKKAPGSDGYQRPPQSDTPKQESEHSVRYSQKQVSGTQGSTNSERAGGSSTCAEVKATNTCSTCFIYDYSWGNNRCYLTYRSYDDCYRTTRNFDAVRRSST